MVLCSNVNLNSEYVCINHHAVYPKNYAHHSWFQVCTQPMFLIGWVQTWNQPWTWFWLWFVFVMVKYQLILPISFRVASLALGQSYDCLVPVKQLWRIWLNTFYKTDNTTTRKQSAAEYCACFLEILYWFVVPNAPTPHQQTDTTQFIYILHQ